MAKQRRGTAVRPSRAARSRSKKALRARAGTSPQRTAAASAVAAPPAARPRTVDDVPPPTASRRPAYYEAITAYETGVRALQRRDFAGAAEHFRTVLQRHPDERELVERATLYLRVCERETANRPTGPKTPSERIYAATLALNAGDAEAALAHLKEALSADPENDHGNYIMAVALFERGHMSDAVEHLRRAIALNPDNRALARQDPDLAALRETAAGRELLESPIEPLKRRARGRR